MLWVTDAGPATGSYSPIVVSVNRRRSASVDAYPAKKIVAVYYDPKDPQSAVLEPGIPWLLIPILAFALLMTVLMVLIVYGDIRGQLPVQRMHGVPMAPATHASVRTHQYSGIVIFAAAASSKSTPARRRSENSTTLLNHPTIVRARSALGSIPSLPRRSANSIRRSIWRNCKISPTRSSKTTCPMTRRRSRCKT